MRTKGDGSLYPRCRTEGPGHEAGDHKGCDVERWYAQVEAGRHKNGKRRYMRATRVTKTGARTALKALKAQRDAGVVADQSQTVAAFLQQWLEHLVGRKDDSTIGAYRMRVENWIIPYIGNIRVVRLTPDDVDGLLDSLVEDGKSARSANLTRDTLRSALRWGEQRSRLPRNVAAIAKPLPLPRRKRDDLTADQAGMVLLHAKGDRLFALYKISLTLGPRPGELRKLPESALDLETDDITIEDAKTEAGDRKLPLVAGCAEAVREWLAIKERERAEAGAAYEEHGLLFCMPDGRPVNDRRLRRQWAKLLEAAGVPHRRLYANRHTAGSLMLDAGVPLEVVSAILGHAGLAITSDIYAKHSADHKRALLRTLLELDQAEPVDDVTQGDES